MKLYHIVTNLVAAVFVLLSVGCTNKNVSNELRIGAILPLTGSGAELASQHRRGLEFAVEQFNASESSKQFHIRLILDDDQNDPKNTISILRKQTSVDKVSAVITVISSPSLAIAPILQEQQIPLFANCGNPTITKNFQNVFRNFPTTPQEVPTMLQFAADSLHLKTLALMYIDDAYGKGAEEILKQLIALRNIQLVGDEAYGKLTSDVRTSIAPIIAKKPDAVYIYGYGMATAEVVNKIREMGYDGIILGTYNFSQPPLTTVAKDAIEGSYYTVPTFDQIGRFAAQDFWQNYEKRFQTPPLWNAVVEYDAIMMLAEGFRRSRAHHQSLMEALRSIGDFQGIGGHYVYEPTKDWLLPMSVAHVQGSRVEIVKQND